MTIKFLKIILISIGIIYNNQIFAEKTFARQTTCDSIIQVPDSPLDIVWETENQSTSSTNLIVTENRIYTSSDNGLIQCFLFDGSEKWAAEVLGNVRNNPVIFKDLFLTATLGGDLYSINSNNGDVIQIVGVGEDITTDLALIDLSNPTTRSKGVVFGTNEGNIFCYDIFSFEMLWKINLSQHPLISEPLIIDDKIIFRNSISSFFCVNNKSGAIIWRYENNQVAVSEIQGSVITNGRTIFATLPNSEILAIDLMLGKKLWSSNAYDIVSNIELSFDKQKLIVLDKSGVLNFISIKDITKIEKIDILKTEMCSYIITEDDKKIFLGFSDGSLYSIDSRYNVTQHIFQTNIPITSINLIKKDYLITKDMNGKIIFYKSR